MIQTVAIMPATALGNWETASEFGCPEEIVRFSDANGITVEGHSVGLLISSLEDLNQSPTAFASYATIESNNLATLIEGHAAYAYHLTAASLTAPGWQAHLETVSQEAIAEHMALNVVAPPTQ